MLPGGGGAGPDGHSLGGHLQHGRGRLAHIRKIPARFSSRQRRSLHPRTGFDGVCCGPADCPADVVDLASGVVHHRGGLGRGWCRSMGVGRSGHSPAPRYVRCNGPDGCCACPLGPHSRAVGCVGWRYVVRCSVSLGCVGSPERSATRRCSFPPEPETMWCSRRARSACSWKAGATSEFLEMEHPLFAGAGVIQATHAMETRGRCVGVDAACAVVAHRVRHGALGQFIWVTFSMTLST